MASEAAVEDGSGGDGLREKQRWATANKVYYRKKSFKGLKKNDNTNNGGINKDSSHIGNEISNSYNISSSLAQPPSKTSVNANSPHKQHIARDDATLEDLPTFNLVLGGVPESGDPPNGVGNASKDANSPQKPLTTGVDAMPRDLSSFNCALDVVPECGDPLGGIKHGVRNGSEDVNLHQNKLTANVEAVLEDSLSLNGVRDVGLEFGNIEVGFKNGAGNRPEHLILSQKHLTARVDAVLKDPQSLNCTQDAVCETGNPLAGFGNGFRNGFGNGLDDANLPQLAAHVDAVSENSSSFNRAQVVVQDSGDLVAVLGNGLRNGAGNASLPQKQPTAHVDGVSEDSSILNRVVAVGLDSGDALTCTGYGIGAMRLGPQGLEDRVKISLSSTSKQEKQELRRKFQDDLYMVRHMVQKFEAKEGMINASFNQLHQSAPANGSANNIRLKRAHSDIVSVGPRSRPLNQLSVSVTETNQRVGDNLEKEKRTPKANQFYRNSEFLLGKDKFPPAEINRKSKSVGKKHGGVELGYGMGKFFKSCSTLLERLMKHKHGWVFNEPVDVEALGLHDYHIIIKEPMDLGTVKTRLNKNWYKSPREYAEDVRLTFRNAMTYNPRGQDVHMMAEQLSKIFEDRWAIIEADYIRELRFAVDYEAGFRTHTSRKTIPALRQPTIEPRRFLDRSESMIYSVDSKQKPMVTTPRVRSAAPKKPKAKDPDKRDMTYEEKQKLSTNLQNLPTEKLDLIVQIIKKNNSALCQHNDEIEVDIDSVDAETLWELDRFVTNYKKGLSKNKRKAELALQARSKALQNLHDKNPPLAESEVPKENKEGGKSLIQAEKQGNSESESSSSESSSSDSGSSSSDTDSESSSEDGSDAVHSPRN